MSEGFLPSDTLNEANFEKIKLIHWDTIVIGSGMGGLSTAAILSKSGERVLLLEKHNKFGGCTHEFQRNKIEFDTGLHYVGGQVWKNDNSSLSRSVMNYITNSKVEWDCLDDVYDVAIVAGEKFPMKRGIKNQIESLSQSFPEEVDAILNYWKEVEKTVSVLPRMMTDAVATGYVNHKVVKFFSDSAVGAETVDQALNRIGVKSQKLKDVLTYLHGDYGVSPTEGSWLQHALVVSHYCDGAAYPRGGYVRESLLFSNSQKQEQRNRKGGDSGDQIEWRVLLGERGSAANRVGE